MDLSLFKDQAQRRQKQNQNFLRKLKARPPRNLDELFEKEHDEVFERTDCLKCANCCKTTSPIFYQRDIDRAARALRMKPGTFVETYLKVDDEGDHVLQTAPCPFLDAENYCRIYEDRPAACREYPHTNRKRMHQILDLTYRNTKVCPAVLQVIEKLQKTIAV